jgi:hypothetical protein
MAEWQAFAILTCVLALMALTLVRPSSGMRNIVFGLMLTGMADRHGLWHQGPFGLHRRHELTSVRF